MEWKSFGYIRVVMILVLILSVCWFTNAQNLVPNPSFEEFDDCPFLPGQIEEATGWFDIIGGCDYFHTCGSNGYGVPVNLAGGGGKNWSCLWSTFLVRSLCPKLQRGVGHRTN